MDDILKITVVQPDIIWEDIDANLNLYDSILRDIPITNLIVFPEMFVTGFSMDTAIFSGQTNMKITDWLKSKAKYLSSSLVASTGYFEKNKYYNRIIMYNVKGELQESNKRHLFSPGNEDRYYTKENKREIMELDGWKIFPQICYDLRFPAWSRNNLGYDLIINMANWPGKRNEHWLTLLQARAIENQAYVIGVNRTGIDGNHIHYIGNSCGFSFDGNLLFCMENKTNVTYTVSLSKKQLLLYRKNFNVLKDMDNFSFE